MTEQELEEFKTMLEEKRISAMPELGSDSIEREKAFMFASRDGVYLSQLEDALARIKDGSFGVCRLCTKPVPLARLEAVPTTTVCVPCKEAEQDQKQRTA